MFLKKLCQRNDWQPQGPRPHSATTPAPTQEYERLVRLMRMGRNSLCSYRRISALNSLWKLSNIFLLFIFTCLLIWGNIACTSRVGSPTLEASKGILIVAAENFYGDIARQVGGKYVSVTSILSDPNADPHEYETSTQDAIQALQSA